MSILSEQRKADAEARGEVSATQALWYAWGRLDSGQYADQSKLDVFEFARQVKANTVAFELEQAYVNESIQGQWGKYVSEKYPEGEQS